MRRIDAEIDGDRLSIGLTVDPETLDPSADALAEALAAAIARALEAWRDGQAGALGYEAERRAAHARAIGGPGRRGAAAR